MAVVSIVLTNFNSEAFPAFPRQKTGVARTG